MLQAFLLCPQLVHLQVVRAVEAVLLHQAQARLPLAARQVRLQAVVVPVAVGPAVAVVVAAQLLKPVRKPQRPVCLSSLWMANRFSFRRQLRRPLLLLLPELRRPVAAKAAQVRVVVQDAAVAEVLVVEGAAGNAEAALRLCQP